MAHFSKINEQLSQEKPRSQHLTLMALERLNNFTTECEKRIEYLSFVVYRSPFESEHTTDAFLRRFERALKWVYKPLPTLSVVQQEASKSGDTADAADKFMFEVIEIQYKAMARLLDHINSLQKEQHTVDQTIAKLKAVVGEVRADIRSHLRPVLEYRDNLMHNLNELVEKSKGQSDGEVGSAIVVASSPPADENKRPESLATGAAQEGSKPIEASEQSKTWVSGYLGLKFDEGRLVVTREGHKGSADLSRSIRSWELCIAFAKARDTWLLKERQVAVWTKGVPNEPPPEPGTVDDLISDLNKKLAPLGVRIKASRGFGRRIEAASEEPPKPKKHSRSRKCPRK